MTTADPHEPPSIAALQRRISWRPSVNLTAGPDRIYDKDRADPDWKPLPVGFTALRQEAITRLAAGLDLPLDIIDQPLLWEGDNA